MLFEIMLTYVIKGLAKQTGQIIGWKQMFLHLKTKFLPELKKWIWAHFEIKQKFAVGADLFWFVGLFSFET